MDVAHSVSGTLAVILHADVADSTTLVQVDERQAHGRIREAFQRFDGLIADYHGKVIELRGDALLARFSRASDAVLAALAFQRDEASVRDRQSGGIQPAVRVGIALGEVIFADNTVTGGGVVLAQRMEQLAEPGGVCITPAIREALPARLPLVQENIGEQHIKGFQEPISVYRVRLAEGMDMPEPDAKRRPTSARWRLVALGAALSIVIIAAAMGYRYLGESREIIAPTAVPAGVEVGDRPSVAVLPFDNLSDDPDQEYFADGITEDLTTDLSKISGLFVVARNSAFAFKGQSIDLKQVAQELGVRYVLEGSIRRVGDRVRINAQLIDGESGGHLWADRFDGGMADIFALQDDVNRRIVDALKVELTDADRAQFDVVETMVPEAYELLLRGVEKYNQFNADSISEARELFLRAAELDPQYARAYANIALTYATQVNFLWTDDRDGYIEQGLEYAAKASALDDSIPQIYLTRSILYLSQRQYDAALEAAQRTVEVHPNYADGHATLAFISSYMGLYDRALDALDRAGQINPQSTGIYLSMEGRLYFLKGEYETALTKLEESVERNPAMDVSHLSMAATLVELGRLGDAEWSVEEALALSPDITLARIREESLYRSESDTEKVIGALRKAGVPE